MIIGLDLDGVTAEYVGGLRNFIALQRGYSPEEVAELMPEVTDYGFSNWEGLNTDFVTYHTNAVAEGLYAGLPMMQGASEVLWELSNEGHHIRVLTKRFVKNGQHGKVVADTASWLDQMNIPYRDLAFLAKKTDLHCDVYIDDAPSNLIEFRNSWKDYIIFDAPYNQEIPGDRAESWDDVYGHIQMRVAIENTRRKGE